jgi:DNA mismatch endonuclease (patch repair protein)
MADIYDKHTRSKLMSLISSKRNKSTEIKLITLFKANGVKGWRRGYSVKGHPDFVFLKQKIAIFVDGCFWHGHDCRNTRPKDNEEFWQKKRELNIAHDKQINELFQKRGWTVIRVWECELKGKELPLKLRELFIEICSFLLDGHNMKFTSQ